MSRGVILVDHGSVDDLDDLAAFVTNVRRGRPPSPELLAELRRRYVAIGGRSPLNAIQRDVARKLQARLGLPVERASRLWKPTVREAAAALVGLGVRNVALVPLAQHSAHVYAEAARRELEGMDIELKAASSWGGDRGLHEAFASRIVASLGGLPRDRTTLVLTAHSLPRSVVESGDPYEADFRAATKDIAAVIEQRTGRAVSFFVAFQSQSAESPSGARAVEWLGPTLREALQDVARQGRTHVLFAPVGFLADHVEILYDLDIEARGMAEQMGLAYARAPLLNSDDDLIDVIARVTRSLLDHA